MQKYWDASTLEESTPVFEEEDIAVDHLRAIETVHQEDQLLRDAVFDPTTSDSDYDEHNAQSSEPSDEEDEEEGEEGRRRKRRGSSNVRVRHSEEEIAFLERLPVPYEEYLPKPWITCTSSDIYFQPQVQN